MRPILRPGLHPLRRNSTSIQIGLDPRHAVVLPDDADTARCLELLSRSADSGEYDGRQPLELLGSSGLLLDANQFLPHIPAEGGSAPRRPGEQVSPSRSDVSALARVSGDETSHRLQARCASPVDVVALPDLRSISVADALVDLLCTVGVHAESTTLRSSGSSGGARIPRSSGRATTRPHPATSSRHAPVSALVGLGEPRRELVDGWMRTGVPHLFVRLVEGSVILGPFVVPGVTACLRCLDAQATDKDPSWPLLVEQYAALTGRDRADGVPEPVDAMLTSVAVAWAARDLVSFAEGRRPSTWSTTVRLDPHLTSLETREWLRHPECGCAWGETPSSGP